MDSLVKFPLVRPPPLHDLHDTLHDARHPGHLAGDAQPVPLPYSESHSATVFRLRTVTRHTPGQPRPDLGANRCFGTLGHCAAGSWTASNLTRVPTSAPFEPHGGICVPCTIDYVRQWGKQTVPHSHHRTGKPPRAPRCHRFAERRNKFSVSLSLLNATNRVLSGCALARFNSNHFHVYNVR
jgi:hypothetical protein